MHEIEFHLFDLRRQLAHPNAIPEQVNEDDREGEQSKEERNFHTRRHRKGALCIWIAASDNHRMNGAEQTDREEGDRRAEPADQCIYCAEAGAAVRIFNAFAQHKVGNVNQFRNGGSGQARIPRPPGIPNWPRPDRAEDDRDEEEHCADLNCGDFGDIPFQILLDKIGNAQSRREEKT